MSQFLFQLKYAITSNIYQQVVDNQMFISREVFRGALNTGLSAGWVATEYNNQSNPSGFCLISAEPATWTGTSNSLWNNGANWSGGSVPLSGAHVIISGGATHAPTVNVNVQVGMIWIQASAVLSIGTGSTLSVYNDLINCGSLSSASGGVLCFNSNSSTSGCSLIQNLSGSGSFSLGNLTISNTFIPPTSSSPKASVTLNSALSLFGTLSLTSGILNTSAVNLLTLQNGALAPALTSASASYVNGPLNYQVAATGSTVLNFPIGNGSDCRPFTLTVNHAAASLYNYTAQLYNGSAKSLGNTFPLTADTVSSVHYYTINRTDASAVSQPSKDLNGNQVIQLFFGSNDGVVNGNTLTILKNTAASANAWIDIGGNGAPAYSGGAALTGSITSTSSPSSFNSFSTFALGNRVGGRNPLPIELLSFKAIPNGSHVELNWITATETNNHFFTLERSSDSLAFSEIAIVPGAGTSSHMHQYSTEDFKPLTGISYYRLKQTDFDGKFSYSGILAVDFAGGEPSFIVFPNPKSEHEPAYLRFNLSQTKEILVVVYAMDGKEMYSKVNVVEKGPGQIVAIDPSNRIPAGMYVILATSDNSVYKQKLVIR